MSSSFNKRKLWSLNYYSPVKIIGQDFPLPRLGRPVSIVDTLPDKPDASVCLCRVRPTDES